MGIKKAKSGSVSFHHAKDELMGARDLLEAQRSAGLDYDETLQRLFEIALDNIHNLGLITAAQKNELTIVCSEGPWNNDQKKELALAIVQAGHHEPRTASSTPKKKKNQSCPFFENMMPESTWKEVKAKGRSQTSAAFSIAKVAISINLVNPDQPTPVSHDEHTRIWRRGL